MIGQWSVDQIHQHDFTTPLFLWSGFAGPHDPYDVTESALNRYDSIEMPDPIGFPNELDTKPPPQKKAMDGMAGKETPTAIGWSQATPERIRRMRKHYYANITPIDDWVGRIVTMVEEKGQLDNTLFVFTSDHGDCLGDHHQIYKFLSHYDSVARVLLVVCAPGVERLGERDQLVELIDIGPTLLDLAGLAPLEGANGVSLRPILEGNQNELHDNVFSEYGPRIIARTRTWKLIFYPRQPYGELYHLADDPDELFNLHDHPDHGIAQINMVERMMHGYANTRMRR